IINNLINERKSLLEKESNKLGSTPFRKIKEEILTGKFEIEKEEGEKMEKIFTQATRDKLISSLMKTVEEQMKADKPDWEKVDSIMTEIKGLKSIDTLLNKIQKETEKKDAKWSDVRDTLSELWNIKKDLVIQLLPNILKVKEK
ncbi:MAG: hypothetical protein DRP55_07280, partial [Spirochaetes bacterium]